MILDLNMAGLGGLETLARLRPSHPTLPVLVSSGRPDLDEAPELRQPGVGTLPKPFDLAALHQRLAPWPDLRTRFRPQA